MVMIKHGTVRMYIMKMGTGNYVGNMHNGIAKTGPPLIWDKGGSEELNDGNQKITPKHVLRKNNTYSLG